MWNSNSYFDFIDNNQKKLKNLINRLHSKNDLFIITDTIEMLFLNKNPYEKSVSNRINLAQLKDNIEQEKFHLNVYFQRIKIKVDSKSKKKKLQIAYENCRSVNTDILQLVEYIVDSNWIENP